MILSTPLTNMVKSKYFRMFLKEFVFMRVIRYRQGDFEVLGTLYSTPLYRYVVIAAATDTEGFLHLRKLKIILVIVCLTSLILFAVAGWVFSGKALKPISRVVKRVEEISITSMNLRVPEGNGKDEIGRLARTFNSMLQRLETSFNTQKDFIANASHELQNPADIDKWSA